MKRVLNFYREKGIGEIPKDLIGDGIYPIEEKELEELLSLMRFFSPECSSLIEKRKKEEQQFKAFLVITEFMDNVLSMKVSGIEREIFIIRNGKPFGVVIIEKGTFDKGTCMFYLPLVEGQSRKILEESEKKKRYYDLLINKFQEKIGLNVS